MCTLLNTRMKTVNVVTMIVKCKVNNACEGDFEVYTCEGDCESD